MTGEMDLQTMLATLSPVLVDGEFVFCTFRDATYGAQSHLAPVAAMQENEGLTLVVPRQQADQHDVDYDSVFRCITLTVHSSLDAVGLTAAFATQLTKHGISANVIAGYFHDHIFVQADVAESALAALADLSGDENVTHIGVDGCRAGWFFARERAGVVDYGMAADIAGVMRGLPESAVVLIDIPIGLRDASGDSRGCDVAARKLLGKGRSSSVFPAPIRPALHKASYAEANRTSRALAGKGLSRQAFGLAPKIRDVDDWLASHAGVTQRLRESHPEVCFMALNDGVAMQHNKKTDEGYAERMTLLNARLPDASDVVAGALARFMRKEVVRDDIVDALVLLVTAMMPGRSLRTAPSSPAIDSRGLAMEMVYPAFGD